MGSCGKLSGATQFLANLPRQSCSICSALQESSKKVQKQTNQEAFQPLVSQRFTRKNIFDCLQPTLSVSQTAQPSKCNDFSSFLSRVPCFMSVMKRRQIIYRPVRYFGNVLHFLDVFSFNFSWVCLIPLNSM